MTEKEKQLIVDSLKWRVDHTDGLTFVQRENEKKRIDRAKEQADNLEQFFKTYYSNYYKPNLPFEILTRAIKTISEKNYATNKKFSLVIKIIDETLNASKSNSLDKLLTMLKEIENM